MQSIEARARRLFVPQRHNGPVPRFQHKIAVAAEDAQDHDDVGLVTRLGEMLEQAIAEVEHMIEDEVETAAMQAALREALKVLRDAADDATADCVCVLDSWALGRDARLHGNALDQRRMVRI